MTEQEIDDYLYYEFDVASPSELSDRNRYIAYERLKHKLMDQKLSPDEFTSAILKISDHLEI